MEDRPFPWKCAHCGEKTIQRLRMEYSLTMEHDGRKHLVTIPDLVVPRCGNCGEIVLDTPANEQISAAFRRQLGLLQPEHIRRNRERLGMTQKQLAALVGIAESTLSRWETGGQIQQKAMDRLLRIVFAFPRVRSELLNEAELSHLGAEVAEPTPEEQRSQRFAELADAIERLPQGKKQATVAQLRQFVELVLDTGSPTTTAANAEHV